MSSDLAICARGLGKTYLLYDRPADRLKQFLWRGRRTFHREFHALSGVDLDIRRGEVVGIVGRNGAGKSTLLQLVCGTLTPSQGEIEVNGRVAALLELGAGFNPEFSGRENVFMNASILGLSQRETEQRYEEIVEFSGIRDFIDQPVKTYSSGMFVRLAFAVATSVDPDILVIDEALSVGDGAFARKSFDRIMALRDAGTTILFCSHSTYHIDALCERVLWLEHGKARMLDLAQKVTAAYNTSLALGMDSAVAGPMGAATPETPAAPASSGRIIGIQGECDGVRGTCLAVRSQESTVSVAVDFAVDPSLPPPTVALGIESAAGVSVSSVISSETANALSMDASGRGQATVTFPKIPLLKGEYSVSVFLACEQGLHVYDFAPRCLSLEVTQEGVHQGLVALPHAWREAL
jgi:lipopolysaccharide transport system ATP-binding protein